MCIQRRCYQASPCTLLMKHDFMAPEAICYLLSDTPESHMTHLFEQPPPTCLRTKREPFNRRNTSNCRLQTCFSPTSCLYLQILLSFSLHPTNIPPSSSSPPPGGRLVADRIQQQSCFAGFYLTAGPFVFDHFL